MKWHVRLHKDMDRSRVYICSLWWGCYVSPILYEHWIVLFFSFLFVIVQLTPRNHFLCNMTMHGGMVQLHQRTVGNV